jgi:hypothetical protein
LLQACSALVRTAEFQHTRAAEPAVTLPSRKWAGLLNNLLWACDVASEMDLPPIWHDLASAPKLNSHAILQQSFIAYVNRPGRFHHLHPVITDSVYKDVMALRFCGESHDDIAVGITPFAVTEGSTSHRRDNLAISKLQMTLAEGATAATLRDLEQLQSKVKLSVPHSFLDFTTAIGVFGNYIAVLLGDQHDLVTAFRHFHTQATITLSPVLQEAFESYRVHPAQILRRIQLECFRYFNSLRHHQEPATPNFCTVTDELQNAHFNHPFLPAVLERLLARHVSFPGPPSLAASDASSASSASGVSTLSGSYINWGEPLSTVIPPFPRPASPNRSRPTPPLGGPTSHAAALLTASARPARTTKTKVSHPNPDPTLKSLFPANMRVKTFLGDTSPPQNDDNCDMCLKFHLTDGCWTNCSRAADHRTHNPAEHIRLKSYVQARARALGAPPATPTPP